jgi:hypothetical protein
MLANLSSIDFTCMIAGPSLNNENFASLHPIINFKAKSLSLVVRLLFFPLLNIPSSPFYFFNPINTLV